MTGSSGHPKGKGCAPSGPFPALRAPLAGGRGSLGPLRSLGASRIDRPRDSVFRLEHLRLALPR